MTMTGAVRWRREETRTRLGEKTNLTRLSGFPALSAAINTLAAAAVSSGETRSRRSEEVQEGPRVQEEERRGSGGAQTNALSLGRSRCASVRGCERYVCPPSAPT